MALPSARSTELPPASEQSSSEARQHPSEVLPTNLPQASKSPPKLSRNGSSFPKHDPQPLAAQEHPTPSKKGRKRFSISGSVERGIIRLLNYTDVTFDRLSTAVEEAKGPGRQWLRHRLQKITGTTHISELRLLNNKTYAGRRKERQAAALKAARRKDAIGGERAYRTATEVSTQEVRASPMISLSGEAKSLEDPTANPELTTQAPVFTDRDTAGSWIASNTIEREDKTSPGIELRREDPLAEEAKAGFKARRSNLSGSSGTRMKGENDMNRRQQEPADFTTTQPASSVDGSSIRSAPSKRTLTDGSNDVPGVGHSSYSKKRRLASILSMSSIIRNLDDTGDEEPGYFTHFGKRCSATAQTIASRISSRTQSRTASKESYGGLSTLSSDIEPTSSSTLDSEYKRFYDNPTPEQFPEYRHIQQKAGLNELTKAALPLSQGRSAVSSIMYAKSQSMSDEQAELHLQTVLPREASAVGGYIDAADERGVTALHLAVAYGYPRVCRFLLQNDANSSALTQAGASVSCFAKPAQNLAGHDSSLYFHIMHCRQWIEHGGVPPVPSPIAPSGHRKDKYQAPRRTATNSTLGTVNERPVEEARASMTSRRPMRRPTVEDANPDPPPTGAGPTPGPSSQSSWNLKSQPQYAPGFTDSPRTSSVQRNFQHRTQAVDFASPNFISLGSAVSNLQNSEGTRFAQAVSAQPLASVYGVVPLDSTSTLNLPSSIQPSSETLPWTSLQSVVHRANGTADLAQGIPTTVNPYEDDQYSVQSFPIATGWPDEEYVVPSQPWNTDQPESLLRDQHQYRQAPEEHQLQYQQQAQTQMEERGTGGAVDDRSAPRELDLYFPNTTEVSMINVNCPSANPVWFTCPHGHAWSREIQYCTICPRMRSNIDHRPF